MSQDEFTKLFKYMEKRFDSIDKTLEDKANKQDVKKLLDAVDSFAKRQEIDEDERLVMAHQLERLDK
jgi:hypothetical protein